MTPPGASRGGASRTSGNSSAVRGAALVGLAVIAGVVGLQIVDDSGGSTSVSSDGTTTGSGGVATTLAVRPPAEVRVKIYNASGVTGVANTMTNTLRAKGYNMQTPDTISTKRAGTSVECRAGFEREAAALADAIGNGATVAAFPSSPPTGAASADCIVIVGTT